MASAPPQQSSVCRPVLDLGDGVSRTQAPTSPAWRRAKGPRQPKLPWWSGRARAQLYQSPAWDARTATSTARSAAHRMPWAATTKLKTE